MIDEIEIALTPAEREAALWAIDVMPDYFAELVNDGEISAIPPIPKVNGSTLHLPNDPESIADLLSRFEVQAPDMIDSFEPAKSRAFVRTTSRLARKIRQAIGNQPKPQP